MRPIESDRLVRQQGECRIAVEPWHRHMPEWMMIDTTGHGGIKEATRSGQSPQKYSKGLSPASDSCSLNTEAARAWRRPVTPCFSADEAETISLRGETRTCEVAARRPGAAAPGLTRALPKIIELMAYMRYIWQIT